jgi:hypothetical protein
VLHQAGGLLKHLTHYSFFRDFALYQANEKGRSVIGTVAG